MPEPVGIELTPRSIVFDGRTKTQTTLVTASYSDGSQRDVTRLARFNSNNKTTAEIDDAGLVTAGKRGDTFVLARFARFTIGSEVIVLPQDSSYQWPSIASQNYIDELVHARLQQLHLLPSALCTDEEFLRRVYLDVIGLPPTIDEYRRFMADTTSDKRVRLVDALVQREEFADLWAAKWGESVKLMGMSYAPLASDDKAAEAYYEWIRLQMAKGTPLDEFVRTQITATGSNLIDGPVNLYTMLPQNPKFVPKDVAQDVAQLFTGIRIQCAECHNHPFDRWTMDDYYSFVSFFTGVKRKQGSEPREFYIFYDVATPPAKNLLDERPMPPRVLGGLEPVPAGQDPRVALASWLTAPENPFFARNLANRIWAHFFGRGIVEPVDDLRISNPPSNQPLLDGLTAKLVEHKFSLRAIVKDICNSRTYQLSVQPNATNASDERQFSRAVLRRLRSDVLLDALTMATDCDSGMPASPLGTRAIEFYPHGGGSLGGTGDYFLDVFGRSRRGTVCACETRNEPTLSQTLHLISGQLMSGKLGTSKVVPNLIAAKKTPAEIIEELFIRSLSRRPTPQELDNMLKLVGDRPDAGTYADIYWGLLNSTEFIFNH